MFDSCPAIKYHPIVQSLNSVVSNLSPYKLVRWVAACPEKEPTYATKERLVNYVVDLVELATGSHKCKVAEQSFMGRLGTVAKRCSIVFVGMLCSTGAVYGLCVGLEKTGEWLKIPYKCMIPQEGKCFGEPIETTHEGVTQKVQNEITCPLVQGPCSEDNWLQNGLNDSSSKIGEWLISSGKEGQQFSLNSATNMLLPIYGAVVAAPKWIATNVEIWKSEHLKNNDLVSDSIKLGTTLFSKVEVSWNSVTEQLAKFFSQEG